MQRVKLVLDMSYQEAEALLALTQCIAGDPEGPRGFVDKIGQVLWEGMEIGHSRTFGGKWFERMGLRFVEKWPNELDIVIKLKT